MVAHFHYTVFGTVVFAMFAGYHYWWPKLTGRMLDERWGKIHFWMLFVGFHTTFLIQHWLGVEGMPRRYADYLPNDGFTVLNQIYTVAAFLLGASMLPFLCGFRRIVPEVFQTFWGLHCPVRGTRPRYRRPTAPADRGLSRATSTDGHKLGVSDRAAFADLLGVE